MLLGRLEEGRPLSRVMRLTTQMHMAVRSTSPITTTPRRDKKRKEKKRPEAWLKEQGMTVRTTLHHA